LLFLATASCTPRTFNTSTVKHDAGQLVAGRHPSYWAQVSPADHEKMVKAALKLQNPETDASVIWEHPVIARLQTWVDIMDATARQTIWGQKYMAATPKPRVFFVEEESPNAFVAPAMVIYPADVTVPGNNGKTEEVGTIMTDVSGPLTAASLVKALVPVVKGRPDLLGDVIDRQRFVLSKMGSTCLPQNVGQGKVTYSGCKLDEDTSAQHGTEFLSKQTAPYIAVHLGLLRMMDEESVVATIAHELGHYYRAHATDDTSLGSGFFYYEKDAAVGKQPKPIGDAAIEAQGREALQAAKLRIPNPISGTAIDSELLMAMMRADVSEDLLHGYSDFKVADFPGAADKRGFVPTYAILLRKCRIHHPNKADCDAFEKALQNPAIQSVLKNTNAPDSNAYRTLEKAFAAAMTELKGGVSSGSVSVDSPEVSNASLFFDPHTMRKRSTEGISSACYVGVMSQYEQTRKLSLPFVQWLSLCSRELANSRRVADQKIGSLVLRGISWYTTEQEADEIGAELISSVGIDAQKASSHLWSLFKYVYEKRANVTGVDYLTCQNLAKNNFGFGTGSVRTVAVGDWSDNHHDLCYRIYNVTRDVLAHNYKTDASKRPQFSTTWGDVLKMLPPPKGDATPRSVNNGMFVE
jgi:hypothetical protein